jgi:taurine dioxygenase
MDIERVTGTIGAEVSGLDLAAPLQDDTVERLRGALGEHLVLFFRDQHLDVAGLKRVTLAFGELASVPYIEPMAGEPYVIAVLKEASEAGISVFGGAWHSDFSFLPRPPGGSVLMGVEVPSFGGDTLWANQILAYETLPDDLKDIVDGRGAVHVGAPYGVQHAPPPDLKVSRSIGIKRGDAEADRETVHPAVRTHPWTGRKALFVNPIYTTRLEGMSIEESKPVLQRLYEHAIRPEFTCRFRWTPGAVAIWDNRTTMHYAINDYDGQRRLMYRTTFAAETPY